MGQQKYASRPLTKAEQQTVMEHMPLVHFARTRYPALYSRLDATEAESLAQYALCLAVQRFDPARGALSTYAMRYILDFWRKELCKKKTPVRSGLDQHADPASGAEIEQMIRHLDNLAGIRAVERVLHLLTPRQLEAVHGVLSSQNLAAMSRGKGLNHSCMRTHLQAAIAKLRKAITQLQPHEQENQ
jgi:hypothetical protein